MKSTKMSSTVQLDQVDVCVDVSKSKLNVYFEFGQSRRSSVNCHVGIQVHQAPAGP